MAAVDTFTTASLNAWSSPFSHVVAVSPSNTVDLVTVSRGLWVGSVGDLKITTLGGETIVIAAVPSGSFLPIRATRVFATLTTASSILALY